MNRQTKERRGAERISSEQQFEQLVDTYQNLVFSICYRITGSYFDAEDLAQDTFLSAYKHLHRFDGKNAKAWLSRIATNKCIDFLKQASRRSLPTEDAYFAELPAKTATPEDDFLAGESIQELYDQCDRLKSPYREIAVAHFCQDQTAAEIAAATGKNQKTIQTQIYRAKAMLKKQYGQYGKEGFAHGRRQNLRA